MSGAVTLLMAIHCHQPVGNFGFVFEQAYSQSYKPFIDVLEKHPKVRLALHYSGPLLDWFKAEHPEFLKRIQALAKRKQVEILASGYYEPILPVVPQADRLGQIAMMRQAVNKLFQSDGNGLWLTERVWEPELPETLSSAGIQYTMVDTNQFLSAKPWLPQRLQFETGGFWDVLGSYTTDYSGRTVRLFPASKQLRYTMPFQTVDKTIDLLRRLQQEEPVAISFADDGEKFGLWPKTHQWVYEEGWLDQFFSALEKESAWLKTETFQDYAGSQPPDGHVYLPGGSYEEMLEWSNGNFRNFFAKYSEANAMQQSMLRVSESLQGLPAAKKKTKVFGQALRALYAGQCNCAYWHGVFGGLYLSHLRRAVYAQLIRAESLANQLGARKASVSVLDVDGDGNKEVKVLTASQSLVIDLQESGLVTQWNLFGPSVNLVDTLSRRPEAYHRKLRKLEESSVAAASGQAPASIHDAMQAKESRLSDYLFYDDHRRVAFHDYGLERMPSLEEVARSTWSERWLWSLASFRLDGHKVSGKEIAVSFSRSAGQGSVCKEVVVSTQRNSVDFNYTLDQVSVPVVALAFNVCLRDEQYLGAPKQLDPVKNLEIHENWSGIRASISLDRAARAYIYPVETVSDSEGGMERTFQGLSLVLLWEHPASGRWSRSIRWALL